MSLPKFLLSMSAIALLALPAMAQHDRPGGNHAPTRAQGPQQPGRAAQPGRPANQPQIFRGGQRGTVGWGDFHHDTNPARITPHRYGQTFLPRPYNWRGNTRDFQPRVWQGGGWRHAMHDGRLGWWWVVGPNWYSFAEPVYPYPDLYTPLGLPLGWWYWCDPLQQYYPYVTVCPVPWESVMPRE